MADFNLLEPSLRLGEYMGRARAEANAAPANNIQSYIRGNVDIQNAQDANWRANETSRRDLEAKDLENIMARAKHDAIMEYTGKPTLSGSLAKQMERERMDKEAGELIGVMGPMTHQMIKDKDIFGLRGIIGSLQGALKGYASHPLHRLDLGGIEFAPDGALVKYLRDKDGMLTHRLTTKTKGVDEFGTVSEELTPEESLKYNGGRGTRHFMEEVGKNGGVDPNKPESLRGFYSRFYAPKYPKQAEYFSQTPLGQKLLEAPEEDKTAKTTNPNEWAVYLAAAKGDPVSAVKLWQEHRLAMEGEKAGIAADKQASVDARAEKKIEAQQAFQEKQLNFRLYQQEMNALDRDLSIPPEEKPAMRQELRDRYGITAGNNPTSKPAQTAVPATGVDKAKVQAFIDKFKPPTR